MSGTQSYICPKEECTGCMACLNACNFSALTLVKDELGFLYPVIDQDKCTDCGLCRRVCPQLVRREAACPQRCYAGIARDDREAMTCSSGGAASAFSRAFLRGRGVVVGCSGEDIRDVKHVIVTSEEEIGKLKKSKYVQSRISDSLFKEIRARLVKGEKVLFIGTGCQVAGLQNFLMKPYENLVTIDLVCHGVPSQQMLDDGLGLFPPLEEDTLSFRKKVKKQSLFGAKDRYVIKYGISALAKPNDGEKPGKIWEVWYRDPYMGSFISGVSFRQGCYKCLYARPGRQSDITLGDFWGLGKDSKFYGRPGVSAILINTAKGEEALRLCSDLLELEERSVEEAVEGNGQLQAPSRLCPKRGLFVKEYTANGIKEAYRRTVYPDMVRKHLYETVRGWLLPFYPIYKFFRRK